MEAGRLRHLVEIQDYTTEQDSNGDDIKSYSIFATVHAEVKTLRGTELFNAQQLFAAADTQITIRYLRDVDERMRVYHDGVYYDIQNVDDVKRKHTDMVLTCQTGVADER